MKRLFFTFIWVFLWGIGGVFGQTLEELREQARALQVEMQNTSRLLSGIENNQKNNRSKLGLILNNITNRKSMISTLDRQVALINRQVNAKTTEIRRMEEELAELKTEYAAMLRAAYRSQQTNNVLAFLFASESFNDITQRIFYIKRYTAMRERKAVLIDSVSLVIQADIAALALKRDSLNSTVRERNAELEKLGSEEQEYQQIDRSLGSQARSYRNQITEQQQKIKSIQDQIQRIIAEEVRRSQTTQRTAAEEEAFVQLTGRFDQNKGKLPYPVSGGVIIEKYGSHTHATQRNVTVNNRGITIAAPRGANIRSVFEGEVVRIFFILGANNTVVIRHGNYFTTYSNLETVLVKAGDRVSTNQAIGKIYSGENAENYILPFAIWNGEQTLNPESWIKR